MRLLIFFSTALWLVIVLNLQLVISHKISEYKP